MLTVGLVAGAACVAGPAHAYTRARHYTPAPIAGGSCSVNYGNITDSVAYQGGVVISNAHAIPVFWGTGVDPTVISWAEGYLSTLTNSVYMDLLSEYSTTGQAGGTNQTIGRGTAGPAVMITPTMATGNQVDDSQIGPELAAQIASGALPAPVLDAEQNPNTVFMLFFPQNVSITYGGGKSCQDFCGYHGSYGNGATGFAYAVIPDMGSGSNCASGCSDSCTTGDTNIMVGTVSHELSESITDPDNNPAWVNPNQQSNNSEIGDICASNSPSQTDTGTVPGTSIKAQYEWSQKDQQCLLAPPGEADGGGVVDSGAADSGGGEDSATAADSGSASDSSSSSSDSAAPNEDAGVDSGSFRSPDSGNMVGTGSDSGGGAKDDSGAFHVVTTNDEAGSPSKGCGCVLAGRTTSGFEGGLLVAGLALLGVRRRRRS